MLTDLYHALVELLSPLGVPLYQADCVPDQTCFPYLTMECKPPLAAHGEGRLTLALWHAGPTANEGRLAQAGALMVLLPARGKPLLTDSGMALLRQKGGTVCVRDQAARGVQVEYTLRFIPKEGGAT